MTDSGAAILFPAAMLRRFWEYVYFCITPNLTVWGAPATVLLVPISTITLAENRVVGVNAIEDLLEPEGKRKDIRSQVASLIEHTPGSTLDQVLQPVHAGIYELADNPLTYPGQRLKSLALEWVPAHTDLARATHGLCHFHPELTPHSRADTETMPAFAQVMSRVDRPVQLSVVIAADLTSRYAEAATLQQCAFVEHMMSNVTDLLMEGVVFCANRPPRPVVIEVIQ